MKLKKHGAILARGFVVVAPIIVTFYVVGLALWSLDKAIRSGLQYIWKPPLTSLADKPLPGIGILVGVVGIYLIGLLAKSWLFGWLINLGEQMVERIPLVKSLYSAVRDLLQFLGGTSEESRGRPAVLKSADGDIVLLGLITQTKPQKFLPGDEERIAVYLPMSYQIGGFTFYVPPDRVEEIEGITVEDLLKLSMTAGVGAGKPVQEPHEIIRNLSGGEREDGTRGGPVHPEPEPDTGADA